MSEEDIKYYNNKLASDSKVVMPSEEAIIFIKEYMKELLDRDDYDIEDVKDDMNELAEYIKDITDSEAEYIVIKECPMCATNIIIEPLNPVANRELLIEQVAVWCMNNCDIKEAEDIPKMFSGKEQAILEERINKYIKA